MIGLFSRSPDIDHQLIARTDHVISGGGYIKGGFKRHGDTGKQIHPEDLQRVGDLLGAVLLQLLIGLILETVDKPCPVGRPLRLLILILLSPQSHLLEPARKPPDLGLLTSLGDRQLFELVNRQPPVLNLLVDLAQLGIAELLRIEISEIKRSDILSQTRQYTHKHRQEREKQSFFYHKILLHRY